MSILPHDFHTPSSAVAAQANGSTTAAADTNDESASATAARLSAQLSSISAQVDAHRSVLAQNDANMRTALIDAEGFPRADMDVAAVRNARVALLRLRNDEQVVRDQMALLLQRSALAAGAPRPPLRDDGDTAAPAPRASNSVRPRRRAAWTAPRQEDQQQQQQSQQQQSQSQERLQAFARLDAVAPDSPAWLAGLQAGDLLLSVGQGDRPINRYHNGGAEAALAALPAFLIGSIDVRLVSPFSQCHLKSSS